MSNDLASDSWHYPHSKDENSWATGWRKIYLVFGFKKAYNFPLFVVCVGALMGFSLSRMHYLNIDGVLLIETIPGDAVHYQSGYLRVGMILHLAGILPAGLLACFQFVPIIRYTAMMFHRLNGYMIILLFLLANAGVYMIIPVAAGGSPSTRTGFGVLATATTISITLAYINIKRLQIDQHRAWMMRTWAYASSIITLRLIMMAANSYIAENQQGDWYDVQTCSSIWKQYTLYGAPAGEGNPTPLLYAQCTSPDSNEPVVIKAHPDGAGPEFSTAAFNLTFGMSLWLAMVIHAIAIETYLKLTPSENERLKLVSYEKQAKAGFKRPGRAGLTADRFGDAPAWKPLNQLELH